MRICCLSVVSLHHADLLQHSQQVVVESLLDNLTVLPSGYRAELNMEFLVGGGIIFPSAPFIGPFIVPVNSATEQV